MIHDISYEVCSVLFFHDVAVEVTGLHEIIIRKLERITGCLPGNLKGRFSKSWIRSGATKTIGPVIWTAAVLLADRSFAALFLSRHPFAFGNLV